MTREEELEAEVARLKERLVVAEQRLADHDNPNVIVLEGRLGSGDEYYATAVQTNNGEVYLAEALEELRDRVSSQSRGSQQITISWHVTDEPKTFAELEDNLVKVAMGDLKTTFSHAYSDLTGYLWTTEKVEVNGHNLLEEIGNRGYLVMRAEIHE